VQRQSFVVFDDYVQGTSPNGTHAFCSTGFYESLAAFDHLSLELWIEQLSGTGTFDLFLEHSADGLTETFVTYNGLAVAQGNGDISLPNHLDVTLVHVASASLGGAIPFLATARLRMFFGGTGTAGLVRIIAHQRDSAKSNGAQKQGKPTRLRPTPKPPKNTPAESFRLLRQSLREFGKEYQETASHDKDKSGA
jgi:hypothetical protein